MEYKKVTFLVQKLIQFNDLDIVINNAGVTMLIIGASWEWMLVAEGDAF